MNKWKTNFRKQAINTNIQKHEILKYKLNKRWTINNRSMPRGVKEVRRKWRRIAPLWTGWSNTIKMSSKIPPKLIYLIYGINGLPVKVSAGFLSFSRNVQTDSKTHKETQWTWSSLTNPGKELKWTVTVPDFKTSTVMEKDPYWHKDRQTDHQNSTVSRNAATIIRSSNFQQATK